MLYDYHWPGNVRELRNMAEKVTVLVDDERVKQEEFAEIMSRDRDRVEGMALTDALTGLPNWRHAQLVLGAEFAAAKRGRPLVVVVFDLDRFKDFNDRYGHGRGDEALRVFGEVLRDNTRAMHRSARVGSGGGEFLSARVGGEEFLCIQGGSNVDGATVFVDRVREDLRRRELGDAEPLTVSAGIAAYHDGFDSAENLITAADGALYEAKRSGRDRVCVA